MRYFGWIWNLLHPNGKHKKRWTSERSGCNAGAKRTQEEKTPPLKLPFTHMLTNVINAHTASTNTSWEFIIAGVREKPMRLFGRFPAYPGLTNRQGCLSQLHSEAANCFIRCDLDLRPRRKSIFLTPSFASNNMKQLQSLWIVICVRQRSMYQWPLCCVESPQIKKKKSPPRRNFEGENMKQFSRINKTA